ncbi:MAG: beta strand repeat-containing protein, partial [Phycisphaerae bacterium]
MTFNPATSGDYTIAGSGSYVLELTANGAATGASIVVNANATISASTTFDNGMNITGNGQLTLNGPISILGSVPADFSGATVNLNTNINASSSSYMSWAAGGSVVNINNNATFNTPFLFQVGNASGTTTININSGGVMANTGQYLFCYGGGQGSTVNVNAGGQMQAYQIQLGMSQPGVLNLNGGLINADWIHTNNAIGGTLNLNGGTLEASGAAGPAGLFNPWIASTASNPMTVNVLNGGVTFEVPTSYNAVVSAALLQGTNADGTASTGGISLSGGGTLALTGNNTFSGPINLGLGTLWDNTNNGAGINGASATAPAITVNNGAALQVGLANTTSSPAFSATYNNPITFLGGGQPIGPSGSTVSPGAIYTTSNNATLTFNGALTTGNIGSSHIGIYGANTTMKFDAPIGGDSQALVFWSGAPGSSGSAVPTNNFVLGSQNTWQQTLTGADQSAGNSETYIEAPANANIMVTLAGGANTLPSNTAVNFQTSAGNTATLNLDGNSQTLTGHITISNATNGPGSPGGNVVFEDTSSGGTGSLTVQGGDFNGAFLVFGGGSASVNSGNIVSTATLVGGLYYGATTNPSTLFLNGGSFTTGAVNVTSGQGIAGAIDLNGGTLRVLAPAAGATVVSPWIRAGMNVNVLNGGAVIDTNGQNAEIAANLAQGTNTDGSLSTGGLTVKGGGALQLDGTNTYAGATTIQAGTTLTLASPGSTTSGGATVATPGGTITGTSALTIASGAALNLANTSAGNGVVIDYGSNPSPNSAIQSYVASGAITTSAGYAVGYANGADGVVSGLSAGQEKIMATLPGDTNLAGTVNLGDLSTVYNNVGITSGATWDQGDFTASGSVTLGDLTSTYNNVGLSLTAGPMISAGTSSTSTAQPMATVMSRTLVAASAASTTPAVTDVTLTVNKATGDAILVFNNASAQFYAWEITSTTGGLSYANLTDIPNFGTGIHARGPTALDGVYSGFATGGFYNPGGTWNLGDIITPSDITSGALDFSFNEFNPSSGLSVTFDP